MTPSELKSKIESRGSETYFFTRANMKFAGDTMRNYGVRLASIEVYDYNRDIQPFDVNGKAQLRDLEVWELYRKNPVKHGLKDSTYFDKNTFNQVFPAK